MSILRKSGPFLNLLSWFGTLALPGRKLRTLKVSKNKFKIIFKTDCVDCHQACKQFSALSQAERRDKLCLKYAKNNLKIEKSPS